MNGARQQQSLALQSPAKRAAALRQGLIDGEEWAKKRAHPSELSRIGFEFEVNKRLGHKTAFYFRGTRPGHE